MNLSAHKRQLLCLIAACLATGSISMGALAQEDSPAKRGVIQISTPPPVQPETFPKPQNPGGGSAYSVDSHVNTQDSMQYEPYNTFPRELDLWNLEGKRLIRSLPVVSPDKSGFVYTDVMFVADTRQTYSRLYWVPVPPPPPPPQPRLPSEEVKAPPPPPPMDPATAARRYDPERTVKIRKSIVSIGYDTIKRYDFKTLTVVDWSATGQRLLVKERKGVLHVGLRTSDILIYDQGKGVVTVYPEIHRIVKHYWTKHGNLPHIEQVSWDIQPLGWEPGSDAVILLKAWAYDQKEKKFLGLWRYDVDAERTQLVQLEDTPIPVAANGWLATPAGPLYGDASQDASQSSGWKQRLKHPFKRQQADTSDSVPASH